MLTGIGADGTQYQDDVTFASELALGEASPLIMLPNDADPTGEPLKFLLHHSYTTVTPLLHHTLHHSKPPPPPPTHTHYTTCPSMHTKMVMRNIQVPVGG